MGRGRWGTHRPRLSVLAVAGAATSAAPPVGTISAGGTCRSEFVDSWYVERREGKDGQVVGAGAAGGTKIKGRRCGDSGTPGIPVIMGEIHVWSCTVGRMPYTPAMLINGAGRSRPHEVSLILQRLE